MASMRTIPNDSGGSVVRTNASATRSTAGSSPWGTAPRKWTRSATPAVAARSRNPSSNSPPPATSRWGGGSPPCASERVDRDVEALEVVGAVEGGDERERRRALRDLEPFAKAALGGARRELVDVDPVWHLHELLGRPLGDSPEVGD